MCGIIGYVGTKEAQPILLDCLQRLEYRGYDSAGLATVAGGHLHLCKAAGGIDVLKGVLKREPLPGTCGIAHTRWATHGPPSERNAHPHIGGRCEVAVVHNGVVENHAVLRQELEQRGYVFQSDTDTEVIAHLIAWYLAEADLASAVRQTVARLKGAGSLAVLCPRYPDQIVGARLGSPLVVAEGCGQLLLASDASAVRREAQRVAHLNDRELVVLHGSECVAYDRDGKLLALSWQALEPELYPGEHDALYAHHMLREIYEQPAVVERALLGRLNDAEGDVQFASMPLDIRQLRQAERLILTACGTSYHAALIGEYLIEELARMPVEVEYASEFRYRNPPMDRHTLVVAISQSGETADTLSALRESKRKGQPTLSICNVPGSSIDREADGRLHLHAGPEIGVASTKAFTAQVSVLATLALYLGRMRHLSRMRGEQMIADMRRMPELLRQTLLCDEDVQRIARRYHRVSNMLYMGRQYLYPVALEGALKLKEISYIHAEGYPAAEMKHGPIALVDSNTPSVFLVPEGETFDKVMSNLEEVKARGGPVIAVTNLDASAVVRRADEVIYIPAVPDYLQPLVAVIPLQLLAYHIALLRGCNVDKPRNLAKSVTVE